MKIAIVVLLSLLSNLIASAPQQQQVKVDSATVKAVVQLLRALRNDPNVMKLVKSVQENVLRATLMGLALGTMKTEKRMELNLLRLVDDFAKTFRQTNSSRDVTDKLKAIETTMSRDRQTMEILKNVMDLVLKTKTIRDYRKTMEMLTQHKTDQKFTKKIKLDSQNYNNVEKMINDLHGRVKQHLKLMRDKANALAHSELNNLHKKNSPKIISNAKEKEKLNSAVAVIGSTSPTLQTTSDDIHVNEILNRNIHRFPQLYVQMPINYYWTLQQPYSNFESFYRFRRQSSDNDGEQPGGDDAGEFDEEFAMMSDNGGGVLGIIAGLSSNEGADVGALAGLISTVITNLLGPGGLDIPSLLSSGIPLITALLSGDDNFGKVAASYLGIIVEGFSGGGGADNNGLFFGNFVGTLLSYLSADPEEEGGPKPEIFFQSFKEGFDQTKQKRGTDEMTSHGGGNKSYFFEFISNIISSLVGGITNFVLNSSLGSSGGSSQGSADLSAGSSQGSHSGSAHASQGSSMQKPNPTEHPKH